jgi:Na+/proline symporter
VIFYALGTALFTYFQQHPGQLDPNMAKNDSISPLFMVQEMPAGVAGLVVAGIFAASMSTFSAINSLSAVIVRDWYSMVSPRTPEKRRLTVAKWITAISGLIITGFAYYLSEVATGSLWDVFSETMALIGGGFGCVMVLALLSKRASTAGAWVGAIFGTILLLAIKVLEGQQMTWFGHTFEFRLSFFIFGTLSMLAGTVVGWLFSLIVPSRKNLDGLTLWTLKKKAPAG